MFAQDFIGHVKQADSTGAPVYGATIEVFQAGHNFSTFKTSSDGSFNFAPLKNEAYTLRISCPGYIDTMFGIIANRKGEPTPATAIIRLKRNGMRLLGMVKSADKNLPLKNVTVVLRNVMTRKEERQTTSADGQYNFKLEYETNYHISVDKRSSGIFNKYRDTSFYISTIGFNIPINYPIDITLTPDPSLNTQMPDGYDAANVKATADLKPVLQVSGRHTMHTTVKPVVQHAANNNADAIKIQKKAELYARQDSANRAQAAQKQLTKESAAQRLAKDSVNRSIAASRQKFMQDSINAVRAENRRVAQEVVAQKHYRDSIAKTSANNPRQK